MITRNVTIDGRRTSIRLEPIFWRALEAIAAQRGAPVNELINAAISRPEYTLTSRVRAYILCEYMNERALDAPIPPLRALARNGATGRH